MRAEVRADISYAAAVALDHRSEPNDRRLAAEVAQGPGVLANPHFPFLNFGNHSSAKPDPQDKVTRNSCLGKEKDVIGLQLPIAASDGTEGVLVVDLQLRLLRGPSGKWEVSWSKVSEVGSSSNQPLKPNIPSSPTNTLKPKPPSTSHLFTAKPIFDSRPNSSQPTTNLKPIPNSNTKPKPTSKPKHTSKLKTFPNTENSPNAKPNSAPNPKPNNLIWKPKPLQPNKFHSLT